MTDHNYTSLRLCTAYVQERDKIVHLNKVKIKAKFKFLFVNDKYVPHVHCFDKTSFPNISWFLPHDLDIYLLFVNLNLTATFAPWHMSCYIFPHVNYLLQDIAECTLIFDTITGTYTTLTFKKFILSHYLCTKRICF